MAPEASGYFRPGKKEREGGEEDARDKIALGGGRPVVASSVSASPTSSTFCSARR
jgi:hypothetical protein